MRSLLTKFAFFLALCLPVAAQNFAYNGQCSKGGQAVVTQGLPSTGTKPLPPTAGTVANNTGVLGSYPSCSVTVYATGTTNKATLFRDAPGSQALTNPFTANTDGSYLFFTASGQYDILMSGGGLPTTVTLTQISLGAAGGGGGGGGGGGSGTPNTVAKFVTPSTIGNSSIIDTGTGMTQAPSGVTVVNSGYGITYPNSPNGTTNNLLACIDLTVTTSSQVTTCATSTNRAIGIVQSGAGITGNAQVVSSGFQNCIFDNQTIIGDAVVPSTTSAGQCSDAGAVRPPQTQGIGRVTTVNSGVGSLATVQMFSLDVSAPGSSTGNNGTVANCGSGGVIAYYPFVGAVVQCDTSVTDDGAGHVTTKSVGTTDTTKAGFIYMVQGVAPAAPPTGAVQLYAPTSVTTPYSVVFPGSAGTGCFQGAQAGNIITISLTGSNCGSGSGSVTNVATTSPISGGPITTTGTISCPTCVTSVSGTSPIASSGGTTPAISINNNGITATQLAAQYSKLRCETGLGDGLNAVTAGTYLQSTCYNDSGVTWTITGIKCFTDNNGTSTLNAANDASTGLLTGAVTCTNAFASGTQSATTTIASGHWIQFTFVADGTSKQTTWVVSFTQ